MSRANFADLLKAQAAKKNQVEEKPRLEIVQPTPPTLDTSRTAVTPHTTPTPPTPISPERDFTKVPNSVVREILSKGKFIGKSKQIYDYLYSLTRGAIKPVRSVRITKSKLMRGSGIGSERTLLKNLAHLKSIGLVKITEYDGQHLGNEYETFLPEETQPDPQHPRHPQQSQNAPPKVGTVPTVENEVGGVGLVTENKGIYADGKTSLKTNTKNDDEPFGAMTKKLATLGKGKSADWLEIAELLTMEFEIAAARTKSVSNAAAFLAEHLRRRLMPKREASRNTPNKSLQVEKQQLNEQIEDYQTEPLTEEGRESTKRTFIGYIEKGQKEFLLGLQDTYTAEDWDWLMTEIKIDNPTLPSDNAQAEKINK